MYNIKVGNIPEIDGYYVTPCGKVYSLKSKRFLATRLDKDGYPRVTLSNYGKTLTYHIHKLVAEVWLGERPAGYEVDHIDRNRQNGKLSNLRYVTHLENM